MAVVSGRKVLYGTNLQPPARSHRSVTGGASDETIFFLFFSDGDTTEEAELSLSLSLSLLSGAPRKFRLLVHVPLRHHVTPCVTRPEQMVVVAQRQEGGRTLKMNCFSWKLLILDCFIDKRNIQMK